MNLQNELDKARKDNRIVFYGTEGGWICQILPHEDGDEFVNVGPFPTIKIAFREAMLEMATVDAQPEA